MKTFLLTTALVAVLPVVLAEGAEEKPLTPIEARKRVNEKITLQMFVKASKNRLQKHNEICHDSKTDFKDEKNMAVVINEEGAARFKKAGVAEPAGHFKGKTIRVTLDRDRPRIIVSDPAQIRIIEKQE